jgi:hypothetical protein
MNDSLRARIFAGAAPADTAAFAAAIDGLARTFAIEWIEGEGDRCRDYTTAGLRTALAAAGPNRPLALRGADRSIEVYLETRGRWRLVVDAVAPLDSFATGERGERLFEAVIATARACGAAGAWAHSELDLSLGDEPALAFDAGRVIEVCWLNHYGRDLSDRIGQERCASIPALHLDRRDGDTAYRISEHPASFASPNDRRARALALAHLDPEIDVDSALAAGLERTALLGPFPRRWDPDIAEILESVVAFEPPSRRRRKSAELDDYRPPAVSEFEPLGERGCEPDLDLLDALETEAETLVALLHAELPEVAEDSSAVLSRLDAHFWRTGLVNRVDRRWIERVLWPALGAYLGEILSGELGGRWRAGARLEDSTIALGDRAWKPFERARRFLQSHRAAIDYSTTKFFREAERHTRSTTERTPCQTPPS